MQTHLRNRKHAICSDDFTSEASEMGSSIAVTKSTLQPPVFAAKTQPCSDKQYLQSLQRQLFVAGNKEEEKKKEKEKRQTPTSAFGAVNCWEFRSLQKLRTILSLKS